MMLTRHKHVSDFVVFKRVFIKPSVDLKPEKVRASCSIPSRVIKGRSFFVTEWERFFTSRQGSRETLTASSLGSVELQSTRQSEYTAPHTRSFPFLWW